MKIRQIIGLSLVVVAFCASVPTASAGWRRCGCNGYGYSGNYYRSNAPVVYTGPAYRAPVYAAPAYGAPAYSSNAPVVAYAPAAGQYRSYSFEPGAGLPAGITEEYVAGAQIHAYQPLAPYWMLQANRKILGVQQP
jgi:hypothetical protein